jgi:hypothetical protein
MMMMVVVVFGNPVAVGVFGLRCCAFGCVCVCVCVWRLCSFVWISLCCASTHQTFLPTLYKYRSATDSDGLGVRSFQPINIVADLFDIYHHLLRVVAVFFIGRNLTNVIHHARALLHPLF